MKKIPIIYTWFFKDILGLKPQKQKVLGNEYLQQLMPSTDLKKLQKELNECHKKAFEKS
jgi:hypothetical protein